LPPMGQAGAPPRAVIVLEGTYRPRPWRPVCVPPAGMAGAVPTPPAMAASRPLRHGS
jgi:hypothetical protein